MTEKDFSVSIEEANEIYEDAILEARQILQHEGLAGSSKPRNEDGSYFNGHLPTDVHKASLSEISEIMVKMTAFADYVQSLAQRAKEEKRAAEEKLKFNKSKIRKQKAGSKGEQDDATITDYRYVTANAEYLTKLHAYEAITAREEAARRDIKTLSRLVSTEQINNETSRQSTQPSRRAVMHKSSKRWK